MKSKLPPLRISVKEAFECLDKFLNLCRLTVSVTQIVKLSTANFTASDSLYLNNIGRVNGESFFNTYTVGNTSNGECLGNTAVLLADNGTLKELDSFSGSFFDSVVNSYNVTNLYLGDFCFELLICESLDYIHFKAPPSFFSGSLEMFMPKPAEDYLYKILNYL